jgi:serine/threonine protein phosphatase PrpC/cytochrome c-type biogenesis protein CcmH/NrfG
MDKDLTISSAAVSDRGLSDKRPQNEDSYLEMPAIGIFAVADGVGGAQAGEVASQMAVEILGEAFSHLASTSDAETAMLAAMEQANSSIFQMAHELPSLASMATTIVALHLKDDIATIGHVGDSRIYRVDPSGNIFRETDDHSIVAEEVRAGRMTEEQADNHPSKNVISRALGAEGTVQPDLKTIMVEPGTSFLLCSDGITRHVNDAEIRNLLSHGSELEKVCQSLKDLVFERGAEDNMTAVLVRVGDFVEPAKDSTTEEMPGLDTVDNEEPTVATARASSPFDSRADDEDLLELETGELTKPLVGNETIVHPAQPETPTEAASAQTIEIESPQAKASQASSFSMFGTSDDEPRQKEPARGFEWGSLMAGLILGAVIAFGVFYFALKTEAIEQPAGPPLTEMRAANIPLSAFEENRRDVDKDPAGYIAKFANNPQDCEDYYLLGRAYLLSGDFEKARSSFETARTKLSTADPVNQKTIAADIATSLIAITGTTSQTMLKKELDAIQHPVATDDPTVNSNTTGASNTMKTQPSPTLPPIVN